MSQDIPVNTQKTTIPSILAVDFDGTLVSDKFPNIGEINQPIWDAVLAYQAAGWKIILWSCRTDVLLQEAIEFCRQHGLTFDAANDNLPEVKEMYRDNARKVFATLYVDDRNAILSQGNSSEFLSLGLISTPCQTGEPHGV